jgi:hypothetical protein
VSNLFKVKGPCLPEFNYLYLKEMKRRVKERKQEKDLRTNKRKSTAVSGKPSSSSILISELCHD